MELRRVSLNPWDFTLYRSTEGSFVLKVVFSEGAYKMDIERYFVIGYLDDDSMDTLKRLAAKIRDDYPNTPYSEIRKADVTILK